MQTRLKSKYKTMNLTTGKLPCQMPNQVDIMYWCVISSLHILFEVMIPCHGQFENHQGLKEVWDSAARCLLLGKMFLPVS